MKELARSTDPVFLSWILDRLADHRIDALVFDMHASIIEGSIGILPRRVMVSDEDYLLARRLLDAGPDGDEAVGAVPGGPPSAADLADATFDTLLAGRVRFFQPAQGYRVAIDPVLLAAAAPARARDRVLDLGTGTGAAALCLLARVPGCRLTGIERHPEMAAFARRNAFENDAGGDFVILEGDLRDGLVEADSFDGVVANPPYRAAGAGTRPPDSGRAAAHAEDGAGLADWADAALRALRPRGWLVFILPAARLDACLALLHGRAGEISVDPLWPKTGRAARRVLIRARKGVKGGARISPGLVLHAPDGSYTEAARRILEDGAPYDPPAGT